MADIQLKNIKRFDDLNASEKVTTDSNDGSQDTVKEDGGYGKTNPAYVADIGSDDMNGEMNNSLHTTPDQTGLRHRNVGQKPHDNVFDTGDDDQYVESSDDDDDFDSNYARAVDDTQKTIAIGYEKHKSNIWTVVAVVFAILWFGYFGYSMSYKFDVLDEGCMRLLIVTILATVFIISSIIWSHTMADKDISASLNAMFETKTRDRILNITYWFLVIASALFIVIFVIVDVAIDNPRNLISALGIFVFIALFYIFSHNPAKVNWRPVFWGLALQFYFALFILRTNFGYEAFQWLGDRISEFLAHTDAGSKFVFGDEYEHHFFALKVLTVIIFFSSAMSVLYYLGVMQFIIRYIARFLAFCLGTSPTESLSAAGNIFIGQTEAPLMISPFLKDMTRSELHAVCTGGFATIAGGVMAAYIYMGVPPNHLLSASVMSAPAALAMSKLFYPETKKSKSADGDAVYNMAKGTETNIVEACSKGASMAAPLIGNIIVNLIAFIAILQFVDQTLIWLGHRCGMYNPELTFRIICSYVFFPLSWLLGTTSGDEMQVASIIGIKTFLNEFVAYAELSIFINNTNIYDEYVSNVTGTYNGTTQMNTDLLLNGNGVVLIGGILSERSIVIATYALCGFSNIGSIGIQLGALGAMAPHRRTDLAKIIVRAMIAGNVACFMTACIAGLLYTGPGS